MDYTNIGARLNEIEKKIDNLSKSNYTSSSTNSSLAVINENISKLFNYVVSKLDKEMINCSSLLLYVYS